MSVERPFRRQDTHLYLNPRQPGTIMCQTCGRYEEPEVFAGSPNCPNCLAYPSVPPKYRQGCRWWETQARSHP